MGMTPLNKQQRQHRDQQIIQLRLAGASMRQIADRVGCALGVVHKALTQWSADALEETRGDVDALRRQEAARLDTLQVAVWKNAVQGNVGAIDRALRIMERRAKLLGLDAPVTDAEAARMGAAAGAAAGAAVADRKVAELSAEEARARYEELCRRQPGKS
jgi:hypothetical protein